MLHITLDNARFNKVTWDRYPSIWTSEDTAELAFYTKSIKYMEIVEPYHLDRLSRQLGHVQRIPSVPYNPT
ncbi:hypothetical protein Scep_012459 [Stephania cephalantha]|uniref:Uncharacterized protein n=1 Tax=Stephania cephalantha TaxID=152367 RepID=A0AAP0JGJ8_9MAGN